MNNSQVSPHHIWFASLYVFFCFYTYYKACATSPGEITKSNVKKYNSEYKNYFDGILYTDENKCSTCNLIK